MAKETYFIDSEDEAMYLEMLEDMDFETAMDFYREIEDDTIDDTHLSGKARNKPFSELSYKNLRYLILGCKYCGAELRVKAMATFIYRASLPTRLNALVSNDHLMKILHDNLSQDIKKLYEWSKVEYKG